MSKNKYRSEKFEKRKKQILIRRIIWSFILFLFLLGGLIYWMNTDSLRISSIEVSELKFADEKQIKSEIEKIVLGKYFGLIPRDSALFIPKSEIVADLISDNTFIESVKINVEKFDILKVQATEYSAVAKWCGSSAKQKSKICYLLNSRGNIFTKETVIGDDIPVFYGPISEEYIIGKGYLKPEQFQNVLAFVKKLEEMNIFVRSVDTKDFETLAVQTTAGPYIMISTLNDSTKIIENLDIVIKTEEINKAQFSNLEYIDLRFTNKAFYKIK